MEISTWGLYWDDSKLGLAGPTRGQLRLLSIIFAPYHPALIDAVQKYFFMHCPAHLNDAFWFCGCHSSQALAHPLVADVTKVSQIRVVLCIHSQPQSSRHIFYVNVLNGIGRAKNNAYCLPTTQLPLQSSSQM